MATMLNKKRHNVYRTSETYVDGLPDRAADETLTVLASIQPMSQNRLQMAPEGLRSSHAIVIYADRTPELRAYQAGGPPADEIEYDGRRYLIYSKDSWPPGVPIPHIVYQAFASETARSILV